MHLLHVSMKYHESDGKEYYESKLNNALTKGVQKLKDHNQFLLDIIQNICIFLFNST